ncbi:MAG TPA: hypothetical protein VHR66_30910 [Gemmataceae bacterium]|nr:hypothetical protein [Gemmataceae bacterium]
MADTENVFVGRCSYKRTDGVWVLYSLCNDAGPTSCPAIPNWQVLGGTAVFDRHLESEFLASFRRELGDDKFTFQNDTDVIVLDCASQASNTDARTMTYYRDTAILSRFKFYPMRAPVITRQSNP